MGCDIHFYAERREAGRWVTADTWSKLHDQAVIDTPDRFFGWRDYDLFAILANVRNSNDLLPIDFARGVPDDCCPEFRGEADRWIDGAHHHSWLTLQEILSFDWTITHAQTGWVGPCDWYGWTQRRRPNAWQEHIPDGTSSARTNAEFARAMATLESERKFASLAEERHLARFCELVGDNAPVTEITWQVPYHELVNPKFWSSTIPRLLALSRSASFDDVRAVFFFDN